ncbi:MAG: nitrate ABC transporter, permease protein, partial [Ectothiorhodospiraceae bacterium]|nr:nitrate ABC transporter, permease protein [Ectothiorhodospiraceae bacterium]
MLANVNVRAAIVSIAILAVLLIAWEASVPGGAIGGDEELSEYEMLTGGGSTSGSSIPAPSAVISHAITELSDPFYDRGTNDKGIGTQLLYSVGRVLTGYGFAVLLAVPLGFVIGMTPV